MKKYFLTIALMLAALTAGAQEELSTYYDSSTAIKVEGFTWQISSITLTDTLTYIKIDLIPSRVLPRLEYYTNPPAVITYGNSQITCIGALDRQSDLSKWHASVRGRAYGWGNAEPESVYSYTLVFGGRIPFGQKEVKISNVRAGGYAFSFSTQGDLENPDPCENVEIVESEVMEAAAADKYGIVGVYESMADGRFSLAAIRYGTGYRLVCLSGGINTPWWHKGDVKATTSSLRMSGENIIGQASCFMTDKHLREVEITFEKTGLTINSAGKKEVYVKK